MKQLLPFQLDAVKKIMQFYYSPKMNGRISISSGLGRNKILVQVIYELLTKHKDFKILYLSGRKEIGHQLKDELYSYSNSVHVVDCLEDLKMNGIFITDYQSILRTTYEIDYNFFDVIICDMIECLNDSCIYPFYSRDYKNKRLSVSSSPALHSLIKNDELIFEYTLANAVEDGYFSETKEHDFILFLSSVLEYLGFKKIKLEERCQHFRMDICAIKEDKKYIFEVKYYRTKSISIDLIESACHQLLAMTKKYKDVHPILIISSFVDEELKEKILKAYQIEVWDIANLIFLCSSFSKLSKQLSFYISYSIYDISPVKPLEFLSFHNKVVTNKNTSYYQMFEQQLANCHPGKDNQEDKAFEKICTNIIEYLFSSEFFQMSKQHKTNDDLFRMDLICSLKGTTEFWKFLIQFYSTKFVVFEFKNYSKKLSQNLLFIASKYLFPEALRNVCFMISRLGINENAQKVIDSKIKSEKKLLISLTDEDLLIMVAKKEQGEDPSDYLLEKVENMLMSLSVY